MTAHDLATLQNVERRKGAAHERARSDRDTAIRQAIAEGWTHALIAQATGLARSRVGQIAHGTR